MDNEETMLDDGLDTELEENTADVEDDATDDGDEDDEFEYDDDGNITLAVAKSEGEWTLLSLEYGEYCESLRLAIAQFSALRG